MTDPTSLREDAYGLESLLDDQTLNGTNDPLLPQAESTLLGTLDQIFIQKRFTWYQPFMVGLAAEALIEYNEQYPDPTRPVCSPDKPSIPCGPPPGVPTSTASTTGVTP